MPSYEYAVNIFLQPQPVDPADYDAALEALQASWPASKQVKWSRLKLVLPTDDIGDFRTMLGNFIHSEMPLDIVGGSNWDVEDPFPPQTLWLVGPNGLHQIIGGRFNYRIGTGPYQQWQVAYTVGGTQKTAPVWIEGDFARSMVIP